jgi:hypothetical protein
VAAGEDQPQALVGVGLHRPLELGELVPVVPLPAQDVEPAVAGHGEKPGVGSLGNALGGPTPQRGDDGVLDEILGGGEVAGDLHQ